VTVLAGVVAYILISGHHPFGQASFEEQYQRVLEGRVDFEVKRERDREREREIKR
jgi:hypothetical protein